MQKRFSRVLKGQKGLPEIVVTPNNDTRQAIQKARLMFPSKKDRDRIYKDYDLWGIDELGVSQTDAINRLYDLFNKSGRPKLSTSSSLFMGDREHYNPLNNTIYLPDPTFDGYVDELTHANQNATGKWPIRRIVSDIIKHPIEWISNSSSKHYDPIYKRKDGYEYDAHQIIGNDFWNYISQ